VLSELTAELSREFQEAHKDVLTLHDYPTPVEESNSFGWGAGVKTIRFF